MPGTLPLDRLIAGIPEATWIARHGLRYGYPRDGLEAGAHLLAVALHHMRGPQHVRPGQRHAEHEQEHQRAADGAAQAGNAVLALGAPLALDALLARLALIPCSPLVSLVPRAALAALRSARSLVGDRRPTAVLTHHRITPAAARAA